MAESIKQKKKPVAKLDKILLAQPSEPNPAPEPTPAKITPIPTPGKGKAKATESAIEHALQFENKPAGQPIITNLSQINLDITVDTGLLSQCPGTQVVSPSADPSPVEVSQPLKKRGRKRKIAIDPKYFNKDYITMWPEICMGQKVLVDRYDNVYSYDLETPRWLGVKTVFGKIDTTIETVPRTDYKYG